MNIKADYTEDFENLYGKEMDRLWEQVEAGSYKDFGIYHRMKGIYISYPSGDSMEFKRCLIQIPARGLKVGDIVLIPIFMGIGSAFLHRVVKLYKHKVITKGDNNDEEDKSFHRKIIIGKVVKTWT